MKNHLSTSQQKNNAKRVHLNTLKKTLIITAFIISCLVIYLIFRAPKVPHFSDSSALEIANFKSAWANGDIIVLVRHAERCDQSTAPCLNAQDGITVRGKDVAVGVGVNYQKLGLEKTDIFTSPLTRTKQTANYMYSQNVQDQEWLANCKNIMLRSSIDHKVKGRNLILVTHSDCMKNLEKNMRFSTSEKPDYSASLIVYFSEKDKKPRLLGAINADEWGALL